MPPRSLSRLPKGPPGDVTGGRASASGALSENAMSISLSERWFVRGGTVNGVLAWLLTGVLVATAATSLLAGRLDSLIFAGAAAAAALVPPVVDRSWRSTAPWFLLFVASLPLVFGASGLFVGEFVSGLAVSALALLFVVALQLTTSVRMTPGFAVVFVVLVTLATAGFWAVASAASAAYLDTPFVETNDELMRVFTAAALAGAVGGSLFRWQFRRQLARARPHERTDEGGEVA
jgi:hypothetical protein